jgi:hypothetical protein
MALTNEDLSLWELAHRLADSDPHKRYWFGLPLAVKDTIRLLVNEVLSYRLASSLIMEHRPPDSDLPSEYYISGTTWMRFTPASGANPYRPS